ncbi:phosphoglycolate phosphatase [Goodfellowiella coeruleoviolacea]|uniref:Phosphoglycolate phosphatase n=1 Tax=Goodfellowiella coeruleoviolacea TaxID=334858 RepID=A0AAE3GGV1_9PSEU|nr:phosphoglycolate phosphatase [Goodfellowiella coeruleoviolacea]
MTEDLEALRRVLAGARALLLDFDGPVCDLFARLTARDIAAELRRIIAAHGVDLPVEVGAGPHELLGYVGGMSGPLRVQVETTLAAREYEAAGTAVPTPGGAEVIRAWHDSGRPVGIVSNNAPEAVHRYLEEHDLAGCVDRVEGRDPTRPDLMKPDPHLFTRAATALSCSDTECVLVGDQTSDVRTAHSAGARAIGYSPNPRRAAVLGDAGADAVTTSMTALVTAMPS